MRVSRIDWTRLETELDAGGYARIPGIYSPEQVAGWKKVTAAAHDGGAKIFVQLMHVGRIAHADNLPEGAEVVAPSAIAAARSSSSV